MSRERKLHEDEEAWLGPVAVAIFIEIGWIVEPPIALTRRGQVAVRVGWGPHKLPATPHRPLAGEITTSGGALFWPGRRTQPPRSLRVPGYG
jgi:hypothetical protein